MRLTVFALAVAVCIAASGCGGSDNAATSDDNKAPEQLPLHGAVPTPPPPSPAFTLKDENGRSFGLKQPPGHWVMITFLYTKCPDVCPLIANNLNQVLTINTAKQAGLEVLAVSTDPKNDTAAAVKKYVKEHGLSSRFHYLIGTPKELEKVWKDYHVVALPKLGLVSHTAWTILVDPKGKQRVIYASNAQPSDFIVDLALLTGNTG